MRIEFETCDYEFAHGKAPRGRGGWAFATERNPKIGDVFWASGTYTEAKRAARAHYAPMSSNATDVITVWVMS